MKPTATWPPPGESRVAGTHPVTQSGLDECELNVSLRQWKVRNFDIGVIVITLVRIAGGLSFGLF